MDHLSLTNGGSEAHKDCCEGLHLALLWWGVCGAQVLGFPDSTLGQMLDRGSAYTLFLCM